MTPIVWLGLSALAGSCLVLALVRRFPRRATAQVADKITSTP
jgi:hypothetical protein